SRDASCNGDTGTKYSRAGYLIIVSVFLYNMLVRLSWCVANGSNPFGYKEQRVLFMNMCITIYKPRDEVCACTVYQDCFSGDSGLSIFTNEDNFPILYYHSLICQHRIAGHRQNRYIFKGIIFLLLRQSVKA